MSEKTVEKWSSEDIKALEKATKEKREAERGANTALTTTEGRALDKPKKEFTASQIPGVPKELMITLGDNLYVTRSGLLLKAKGMGMRALKSRITKEIKDDNGKIIGYEAEAKLYPDFSIQTAQILEAAHGLSEAAQLKVVDSILGYYEARATATIDNVKNKQLHNRLMEMAETRAENRALRKYTGSGFAGLEDERSRRYTETKDYIDIDSADVDSDFY